MLNVLRQMVRHKYLLRNFVVRDIKVKYRGTVFGYFWSLLEPLALVAIYYFVFQVVFRRGGPDYPLVVILGVLPYTFFLQVVQGGSTALVGNAGLIRRVAIPREIFVLALVGSNLVTFGLSLLAVVPFMAFYGISPGWRLVLFPLPVLLLSMFGTGIALVASCANIVWRDIGYVIRVTMRLMFYASPVIYSYELVLESGAGKWLQTLYLVNPIAVYLTMARNWFLNRPVPIAMEFLALSIFMAFLSFFLGAYLFARWERRAVRFL